jgi:hypothetical protein
MSGRPEHREVALVCGANMGISHAAAELLPRCA